ncbi:hypothetical protein NEMBOFW57_003400 [Staphylotrichum longicolle]|uniref:Uncharacterized protein n=1 Tax=Staphylotrichum longicolle TaxID=669026 RepID=A0AAD4F562_9PEZI|nr:hypothetical protein NEMBOFW57_003400 [Staphylotrichum longicolle]
MMGLVSGRRRATSNASSRSSGEATDPLEDDTLVVEPDQGNGADLSRVVLPTFILEPRSMLERITKYAQTGRFYFLSRQQWA